MDEVASVNELDCVSEDFALTYPQKLMLNVIFILQNSCFFNIKNGETGSGLRNCTFV
jgi:hypothetical protein